MAAQMFLLLFVVVVVVDWMFLLFLAQLLLLLPFHQFSKVQVQRLCNEEPTAGLC